MKPVHMKSSLEFINGLEEKNGRHNNMIDNLESVRSKPSDVEIIKLVNTKCKGSLRRSRQDYY